MSDIKITADMIDSIFKGNCICNPPESLYCHKHAPTSSPLRAGTEAKRPQDGLDLAPSESA